MTSSADPHARLADSNLIVILQTVGILAVAVFSAIEIASRLEGLVAGLSVPLGPALIGVGAVVGVVVYLVLTWVAGFLKRRWALTKTVVPSNLLNEAVTYCDRIREVWSMSSNDIAGFRYATQAVQLALYPSTPATGLTPQEEQNRAAATGNIFGWRTTDSVGTNSTAIARTILSSVARTDRDWFWLALEMLEIRVDTSMNLANQIVEKFQGTSFTHRATGLTVEWNRFREAANRLAEDYTNYRRRVAEELRQGTVPKFVSVSELYVSQPALGALIESIRVSNP